jgi:hypothetical protein
MKHPVLDRLEAYGLLDVLGREHFHPTIGAAVRDYVIDTGVAWVDWEDDPDRVDTPPLDVFDATHRNRRRRDEV